MNAPARHAPEILAPAGSTPSFLAALSAGADAVYCGLKRYSARMAATNFSIDELSDLTQLAHDRGVRVYVTVNTLIKSSDLDETAKIVEALTGRVRPDAIILQDLAVVNLARRLGFSGELHLSTLANAGLGQALALMREKIGIDRVVVPRELSIDEIRLLGEACPTGLGLEAFIHGALCYAVSGRCYWSSYMGGKSGLRGRCVQPCRRRYLQEKERQRAFSCQDLSLDVLVKILKTVPQVSAWKIEGRKKGPHYVYYTARAYRMLRDEGGDPKAKRAALELLAHSLGRSGTHYRFLPQRPQHPVQKTRQTGSGLFVGRIRGGKSGARLSPREALLAGDTLRVGYEDEPWHGLIRVFRGVPKGGRFALPVQRGRRPPDGTAVFLTDRTEPALTEQIKKLELALKRLPQRSLEEPRPHVNPIAGKARQTRSPRRTPVRVMDVFRQMKKRPPTRSLIGIWMSGERIASVGRLDAHRTTWWLPPVTWPESENQIREQVVSVLKKGGKRFVANAPWQIALFPDPRALEIWAGPFCNVANPLALEMLAEVNFSGVIVSPELDRADYLNLPGQSPLPLGLILSGNYPLCVSRIGPESVRPGLSFASPRGEEAWTVPYGENHWTYPNWTLDLKEHRKVLEKAGYRLFVNLIEPIPKGVTLKRRPGVWNWEHGLK